MRFPELLDQCYKSRNENDLPGRSDNKQGIVNLLRRLIFSANTTLDAIVQEDLNDISNEMQYDVDEQPSECTKTNNYSCEEENLEELLTPGIITSRMTK